MTCLPFVEEEFECCMDCNGQVREADDGYKGATQSGRWFGRFLYDDEERDDKGKKEEALSH